MGNDFDFNFDDDFSTGGNSFDDGGFADDAFGSFGGFDGSEDGDGDSGIGPMDLGMEDELEEIEDDDSFEMPNLLEEQAGNQETNAINNKKVGIIIVIVAVVFIVITLLVSRIAGHKKVSREYQKENQAASSKEATDFGSSNKKESSKIEDSSTSSSGVGSLQSQTSSTLQYSELDGTDEVEFNEPIEMTFTVTGVKHLVNVQGEEMRLKSTVKGSIAGLAGIYEFDVPYENGIKLSTGTQFSIYVRLGDYNGKTVVGEITY